MAQESQLDYLVEPGSALNGTLRVPGDKSISHRAIMFASLAQGVSEIHGFLNGEDTLATMKAFRQMGIQIDYTDGTDVTIHGKGLGGLQASDTALDLGNSGTSVRLISGILVGQKFSSELIGDASLMSRPMRRIVDPLTDMGAAIRCSDEGTLPIKIDPVDHLNGFSFEMPVASAQLKSCLLLAGLYSRERVSVTEPAVTRDHTERMLQHMGCPITRVDNQISISSSPLQASVIEVPADISSAAFFIVAALIVPGSNIRLESVGINPTRHAVIEILQRMGADIELENTRDMCGEPVADICVKSSALKGIHIPEELVPIAIDEFPIIFIAAAYASGQTQLHNAAELRVKESDRLDAMATGLTTLGIELEQLADGIIINGGKPAGGVVDSYSDHRIAMAFAIAGMAASSPVHVTNCRNVDTSFPGFTDMAASLGGRVQSKSHD